TICHTNQPLRRAAGPTSAQQYFSYQFTCRICPPIGQAGSICTIAMNSPEQLFDTRFDAKNFHATGHALIDLLTRELERNLTAKQAVLNWCEPSREDQKWRQPIPQHPTLDLPGLLEKL